MSAPASRALLMALELLKNPALGEVVRRQDELPEDLSTVIRIAGGCTQTLQKAAGSTGSPPEFLFKASRFYVQQALFFPGADSYRVLGLSPGAPQERVREHMRWLMRWLHPDLTEDEWETAFGRRVATAWNDLKSPEKREAYDGRAATNLGSRSRRGSRRGRKLAPPLYRLDEKGDARLRRQAVNMAVAIFTYLVVWFAPDSYFASEGANSPAPSPEAALSAGQAPF